MISQKSISSSNEKKENPNEVKEKLGQIWINIPLFIKCYFIITIILFVLNIKLKCISFYLINIPYYTVFHLQIWRLVTSVFVTTNIFQIILAFFVWIKYASLLETSLGTIKYTLIFFINAICIQIANLFILSTFYLINTKYFKPEFKYQKNCGIWGIVMCEMTLLCLSNPESPMKLFLLPFTIKAKIYPILLIFLFMLVNYLEMDAEILSGVLFGFIYYYYLKSNLQISDSFVQKLETNSFLKELNNIKGFISINKISSGLPVTITKVSNVDNEQEKEKLKGKGVIIAGSLYNPKEEEESETQKNDVNNNVEDNTTLK